ncbi:uncharacterized protein LOC105186038 [Harpegnathos saltator]|uniref:uncharacterized protein LOC105186038 n=1 Tax=Harpegnathos saltator TaxID=610380 RepID=UPI00058B13A4|nr:uncharacterized protein LOC105186038 [Harpegnathos saltator]
MLQRICNGSATFDAIIKDQGQPEYDYNKGRFAQLQRLVKNKLNCCLLIEDDVSSRSHQPRNPDRRREQKPFNGVCVLPNMPDVDALIEEFEANYTDGSPTAEQKSAMAVSRAGGILVKRIVEIYETRNGKTDPWPLDGRQADAEATVEENIRMSKESRSRLFGIVPTSKKTEQTRDYAERRELADATATTMTLDSDSRRIGAQVEKEDDKDNNNNETEENNDPNDTEEKSELTAIFVELHVDSSSPQKEKKQTKGKDKGKSSRSLRRLFTKFNRKGSKRVTRRCRLAFPRQDELWHVRRKGRVFSDSPLNKDFISKCDEKTRASPPRAVVGTDTRNKEDRNLLTAVEPQDDSGNSYKNLQIDMFDFEDEGHCSENDDDSLSLQSIDRFLPSLDQRKSFDGTTEIACLASSSFDNEKDASGYNDNTEATEQSVLVDESSIDTCLEQSTELEDEYLKPEKSLRKRSFKKMLVNARRYFEKSAGKAKSNRRPQPNSSTLSPDSGFGEQSVSAISPSTLLTSSFSSEKSASNHYFRSPLTFRTFRPRDSLPRDGISRWKRRLVLNEFSHENLANKQAESSPYTPNAQPETSSCDLSPASSSLSFKDSSVGASSSPRSRVPSPWLSKHSYMAQKIPPMSTFLSLTRVDEINEELDEQLDMSELRPGHSASLNVLNGWTSSSPYPVCDESRWRSTPTLASFAEESSCYLDEPIVREKPRINHVYLNAKRNVPIYGMGSLSNITSGSSCFATVKPRNWRPYMRPNRSRSSEEIDGVKRRSSV